jgi:hypothetical protein
MGYKGIINRNQCRAQARKLQKFPDQEDFRISADKAVDKSTQR